jgi:uncharacterized protein (TIGR03435 family)
MSAIQIMSTQPWVERLGSTLLHFLWEGLAIAAVYAVGRRWTERRVGPNARYTVACLALAMMAAAPVVTWIVLGPPAAISVAASFAAPLSDSATSAFRSTAVLLPSGAPGGGAAPLLLGVVAIWLVGAIAFWVRMLGGWILAERLRSRRVRRASGEWQQALDRLKTRLGVSRPVQLLVSSLVQAPVVVGWLRPAVLVPVGALAGLPADQIEALLLHELAHIHRHDYLVNLVQGMVEAILFYHPAVWWISGHIRLERELCCDDVAVATSGDVLTYARALTGLESARPGHAGMVMAASGGSLVHRIARLAGRPRPAPRPCSGPATIMAAIIIAATTLALIGQQVPRPKFDVASVKPAVPQGLMLVRPLPGRLTANATLQMLMQNAYAAQAFQITGGPDWINADRFEIDANADGNATRDQIFLMLQSLLEERFQLTFHRETRELPVYALVAAKSGLKLPSSREGTCVASTPDTPPDWAGGIMAPPQAGQPPLTRCGAVRVMLEPTGARALGGKVPMAEFARTLSMVTDRTVIDRTGFGGLFDVQMTFLPDDSTPAMPPPPPDVAAALESRTPSILSALQEQLGLKLESTRGPVEVIVIDHAERPSGN